MWGSGGSIFAGVWVSKRQVQAPIVCFPGVLRTLVSSPPGGSDQVDLKSPPPPAPPVCLGQRRGICGSGSQVIHSVILIANTRVACAPLTAEFFCVSFQIPIRGFILYRISCKSQSSICFKISFCKHLNIWCGWTFLHDK